MRSRKDMGRGTIYAMAGVYICITAYQMYKNLDASTGGEQLLVTIFILLFALLGAGLAAAGGYMIYKGSKEQHTGSGEADSENQEPQENRDEKSM